MGWELIFAMALAAAVTRGYEHSKRRSAAAWEQARRRARQRADQRAKDARERANRRRAWFESRLSDPRHPIGLAHRAGRFTAAAANAAVAGVAGARKGAAEGRAWGAALGRTAAREGWTWGYTIREWRRQHQAQRAQDRREATRCPGCGRRNATGVTLSEDDLSTCSRCRPYRSAPPNGGGTPRSGGADHESSPRHGAPGAGDPPEGDTQAGGRDEGPGPDAARTPPPVMVRCLGCGAAITDEAARTAAGRCGDCQPTNGPSEGTGKGDTTGTDSEIHDAEIVDESNPRGAAAPMSSELQGINMNGANLSGGDGEGYASTITALTQISELLGRTNQVITDLTDQVTAKNLDAETINGLSHVDDLLQAATAGVQETLQKTQAKHEPVADAVAGAGGSSEVADTDWYDTY